MNTEEKCTKILKNINSIIEAITNSQYIHRDVSDFVAYSDFCVFNKLSSKMRRDLAMSYGPGYPGYPGYPPFYNVYKVALCKQLTVKIQLVSDKIRELLRIELHSTEPNPTNLLEFNKHIQELLEKSGSELADIFEANDFKWDFISIKIDKDIMSNFKYILSSSESEMQKNIVKDGSPATSTMLTEQNLQMSEPSVTNAINVDAIADLENDYMEGIDHNDSTIDTDILNELQKVQEFQLQNTTHLDQSLPVISDICSIKLAGFAVDPSLHTSKHDETIKKSSVETWQTTWTDANEQEDSDEVQIISTNMNKSGNKICSNSLLTTESCEIVSCRATRTENTSSTPIFLTRRTEVLEQDSGQLFQNKIGVIFCNGCDTDFQNGNLASIYQHPLKHSESSGESKTITMGCKVCKKGFSGTNILNVQRGILSHITFGYHWFNAFTYANNENTKPYEILDDNVGYCQLCEIYNHRVNDASRHFTSKRHLQYLKILDLYLTYCDTHHVNPVEKGLTPTFLEHLVSFSLEISHLIERLNIPPELVINMVSRINNFSKENCRKLRKSVAANLPENTHNASWEMPKKMKSTCTICQREFSRPDALRRHLRIRHLTTTETTDPTASGSTSPLSLLTTTRKSLSSSTEQHKCHLCGKIFTRKYSLNLHIEKCCPLVSSRTIGIKPKCRLCNMTFTAKSSLNRHVETCVTTWSGASEPYVDEEEPSNRDKTTSSCDDDVEIEAMEPMQVDEIKIEDTDLERPTIKTDMDLLGSCQDTEDKTTGEIDTMITSHSEHLDKKYHYLCLDCEHEKGYDCEEGCVYVDHPRFPITMDIAGHFMKNGHSNFEPIKKYYSQVSLMVRNISYSRSLGGKVRKEWKELINSETLKKNKYGELRKCLKCDKSFDNAVDMFSHIKHVH